MGLALPSQQLRQRYNRQDKEYYLGVCQRYNTAAAQAEENPAEFVAVSVELHAAKANVPKSWRTAAFVKSCGTS